MGRLAQEAGLDLVEVAPDVRPPVCRIMDYGKFRYEQSKRDGKGKHHTAQVKEIQVRPRTQSHDLETKIQKARKFLERGDKVIINMLFRGRERAHTDLARESMGIFVEQLEDVGKVEQPTTMMGRRMILVLAPKK
ncbi:MAG: translation initiation factor IF-3 [Phycisphaerae bacterium]|nr:translation initiation factor IF-3 [Phycisphaerae bacterium]